MSKYTYLSQAEKSARTEPVAKAVATLLGAEARPGYGADANAYAYAHLVFPDGRSLSFSLYNGRFTVTGEWPRSAKGEVHAPYRSFAEPTPVNEITVAEKKTPVQIAQDIERRLLPVYTPRFAEQRKRAAEADVYEGAKNGNLASLAEAIGVAPEKVKPGADSFSFYCEGHAYGDVRASAESADLAISNLPIEHARQVLALVRSLRRT